MVTILFLGDIVGRPGRELVRQVLPALKKEVQADIVIANAENATHGKGLSKSHFHQLLDAGIDMMTLGNHYAAQPEIKQYLPDTLALIRPENLMTPFPGVGTSVYQVKGKSLRVTNLLGQAFMHETVFNPFDRLQAILQTLTPTDLHFVDFHAEATGEKMAFAYAFDGKVTAIVGTHTHIQTADERILPLGTAYITDVGMCGPYQSVLGVKKEIIIQRLWKQEKVVHAIDLGEDAILNGVILTVNDHHQVERIQRVSRVLKWR